jgi:hypothetical protein
VLFFLLQCLIEATEIDTIGVPLPGVVVVVAVIASATLVEV